MDVTKLPGDLVTITNYINPQLFWYADIKKVKNCAKELKEMEHGIQKYFNGNLQARPTFGDLVVLNYLPIRKLIRGRVVEVHQSNPNICTVWAIDYGFPIESSFEHMSSLPQQFEKSFGHIQCGGVGYVKLSDNIPTLQASSCFESILVQAKALRFNPMFEARDGQYFGHLYIVAESHLYSAAEYLIGKKLAIPSGDFESVCSTLPSTQYSSWRSVSGKSLAIKNSNLVKEFKCKTLSDLVHIYTSPPLPKSPAGSTAPDIVKSSVLNKTGGWELPKKSPVVTPEHKHERNNLFGRDKYHVTEAKFDNGFSAEPSVSKMLMTGKQKHLPIDNGYTRFRQRIAALTDPSLQQDKIAEILQMFDGNGGDSTNCGFQNSFRKLDRLLHKKTIVNGNSKPKDSATEAPTNAIKTHETYTNPKETNYRFDYLKTIQFSGHEKIKQSDDDEIVQKSKDGLPLKDAPRRSIDKDINKTETINKGINRIPLKAPMKSNDNEINKTESMKKEINGISLKAPIKSIDKEINKEFESVKKEEINEIPLKAPIKSIDKKKNKKIKPLKKEEINEIPFKAPIKSIDKEINKEFESVKKEEINEIPLKAPIKSIDKKINKKIKPLKKEEINEIPLKAPIKSIDKEINKKLESMKKKKDINEIPNKKAPSKLIDKERNKIESMKKEEINRISKQHNSGNEKQKTAGIEINCNNKANGLDDLHLRAGDVLRKLSNLPNYICEITNSGYINRPGYGLSKISDQDQNGINGLRNMNKNSISSIGKIEPISSSNEKKPTKKYGNIESGKKKPLVNKNMISLIDESATIKPCITEGYPKDQPVKVATETINNCPKSSDGSIGINDIAGAINSRSKITKNIPESNKSNKRWPRHKNGRKSYGNIGTGTDIKNHSLNACNSPKTTITKANENSIVKAKMTNNHKSTEPLDSVESMEKINKIINEMNPVVETIKKKTIPVHGKRPLQVNFMNHLLIAHANTPIIPVGNFDHIDFQPNVRRVMKQRRIDKILEIQKLAWPHLLHGNQSLLLISQKKSGRTWSYLPALCSQVEKQTNLELKKKQANKQIFGPMAIVLVAGIKEAQIVSSSCEALLKNDTTKAQQVVAAYAGQNIADLRISMHNACKILVATTPQLEELFKYDATEKMFNPDRLSFLVLDDLDLINAHNGQQFNKLFGKLLKLCKFHKASQSLKPQLVLTSTHWQPNYMKLCLKHANTPLLIFGDFLEAAVFSKTRLRLKMIDNNDDKLQLVINFLEDRTCNGRTIIYCNECSEVLTLKNKLENACYECLAYIKTSSSDEAQEKIRKWQSLPTKKILIISDECPELKIVQNAKYLLHYTFATTWVKFTRRFISVTKRFYNAVATNEVTNVNESKRERSEKYTALVLLDQNDEMWLPQIQNFMEKHNIEASQPLVSLVKKSKSKLEEERALVGLTLCPTMATYGVCHEYNCIYRHELTTKDMVPEDRKDEIPVDGDITIEVLKVYNPAHFAVIVVKHQQPGFPQSWRELLNKENHNSLSFKLMMHYSVEANNKMHWPPMPNDICVIKIGGQYQRVLILKVCEMENIHLVQPDVYVQVQVMDNNTDILQRKAGALLHCPLEFQKIRAIAINVRITGIVPFNGERTWLSNSAKMVTDELQSIRKSKNMELFGQIDFTLSHTIFLKNIFILENLVTAQVKTYTNLQTILLDKEIAQKDETIVRKLHNIFDAFIKYENDNISSASELQSLDDSFVSALTSCSHNEVSDDYEDANSSGNTTNFLENQSSESNCNENTIIPMNNINSSDSIGQTNIIMDPLSSGRMQSESWCSLPMNELTKIQLSSEEDNGSWNGFFIIRKNNEYKNILNRIADYMMKKQPSSLTSIKKFKVGHNFIIKHNDHFVRAKLLKTYKSSNLNNMYQFLLVDLGNFLYLTDSAIKRVEIIYEMSNELVFSINPYQAIYCKMAGIVMHSNHKCVKVKDEHIYVTAKRQFQSHPFKDMGIKGYEVILYQCDYEDNLSGGLNFNQHLIDSNAADYDELTKTDLDIDLTKNMDPNKSVKLLEQCLKNMMDFEKDTTKDFFKQLFGININEDHDELESFVKPNNTIEHKEKERRDTKVDKQLSKKNGNSRILIKPIALETIYPTKFPQVTWYQNSAFINICIEIPDTTNYVVKCNGSELFYATEPSDDEPLSQLFHIYLSGYVKQVTHEKRGLNVVIKLRKEMCELWPSLMEGCDNDPSFQLPFIKYNLEHVEIGSDELTHVQETQLALSRMEAGLYKNPSLDKDYMDDNYDIDSDKEPECDLNEYFVNNKFGS